jgi:hypothetical protein
MDHAKVLELKAGVAPYTDRLLQMDDLLPYKASTDAPEDSPATEHDHDVERPFKFARKGAQTTFPMNRWILAYKRREAAKDGEPSSSKAIDDANAEDSEDGE